MDEKMKIKDIIQVGRLVLTGRQRSLVGRNLGYKSKVWGYGLNFATSFEKLNNLFFNALVSPPVSGGKLQLLFCTF